MATSTDHRLPVELYSFVARELATVELHAMTLAARLTNRIATPFLYRRIEFQPSTRVEVVVALLHVLIKRGDLSMLVQHLVLAWTGRSDQVADVATYFRTACPELISLQHLTISRSLDMYAWIFDDVSLPSLRHFHCYAQDDFALSFFSRHPDLQTVTAQLPLGGHGIRHWGHDVEIIRLWDGGGSEILRLFKDGEARVALHRIDWTKGATVTAITQLVVQCPKVRQINYLAGVAFSESYFGALWPSVRRVGITMDVEFIKREEQSLLIHATRALARFPNLHTLDFFYRGAVPLSHEALAAVDTAVRLIHAVEEIRLVTAANWAYLREAGGSEFCCVPLTEAHNAPVIPWKLMTKKY